MAILILFANLAHAQLTELYAFQYDPSTISNYPSGENPQAELIQGADGNFYTTTQAGGAGACPGGVQGLIAGCGAIVKITASGALIVAFSFPYDSKTNTAPDGLNPQAGLLQGPDGNFYGVAPAGGTQGFNNCISGTGVLGCGTVFKITPRGVFTTLHSFCGPNGCGSLATDGSAPIGRLTIGPNGSYYGTTQSGGLSQGTFNAGTVFAASSTGAYQVLHIFTGNAGSGDGANPAAGLTLASDGNFYGTTEFGGSSGFGTIFRMTQAGVVSIMQSFAQFDLNGAQPRAALVEGSDGSLYGTCYAGGLNNWVRYSAFRRRECSTSFMTSR